jgi:hypothetical protein
MSSSLPPQWHPFTKSSYGYISFRYNGFLYSFKCILGIGILLGSFVLVGLVFYMTFLSPHRSLLLNSLEWSIPENYAFSSHMSAEAPSSPSDTRSLEQIRDVVATTRGFLSRDYSLYLGWNNVSIRGNPIRTELMIPE